MISPIWPSRSASTVWSRQPRKKPNGPAAYINIKTYKIGDLASMEALGLYSSFLVGGAVENARTQQSLHLHEPHWKRLLYCVNTL